MRQNLLFAVSLLLLGALPSFSAECVAARQMKAGTDELEQRKDVIQRREWLLLEYLSSDGSKKSRKLLEAEVAKSIERVGAMTAHYESLKALPPDTPEEGTPACETITRFKAAVTDLLDLREKELLEATGKKFPFLKACDEMGVQLMNLGASARKPDATPRNVAMLKLTTDIALGPQIYQARMSPGAFDALVDEMFAPTTLPPRASAAYGSLRCLRSFQRVEIKALAESSAQIAQCPVAPWAELGLCLDNATRRQ